MSASFNSLFLLILTNTWGLAAGEDKTFPAHYLAIYVSARKIHHLFIPTKSWTEMWLNGKFSDNQIITGKNNPAKLHLDVRFPYSTCKGFRKIMCHTCPVGLPGFITTIALTVRPAERASSKHLLTSKISRPQPLSSVRLYGT